MEEDERRAKDDLPAKILRIDQTVRIAGLFGETKQKNWISNLKYCSEARIQRR